MTAAAFAEDLFPGTLAGGGPPLKVELGRIVEPDVVIELRGKPVPLSGRIGPMEKKRPDGSKVRFVGLYKPAHLVRFQADLKLAAQEAMGDRPPFDQQLEVLVEVHLQPPASLSKKARALALEGWLRPAVKPDADNFLKTAADACKAVVWTDDKLVVEAHVRKLYAAVPMLRIEVRRLPTCP